MLYLDEQAPWEMKKQYPDKAAFPVGALFQYYYQTCEMYKTLYPFAQRVVSEIDESQLLSPMAVESPIFGVIPIEWISNGAKSLILISSDLDLRYSLDFMGDNCFPLLVELSKQKDIYATISPTGRIYSPALIGNFEIRGRVPRDFGELSDIFLKGGDVLR